MIFGDIETTEKVEYEDLLKNYYEKMEIIEKQDKEIERLNNIIKGLDNTIENLEEVVEHKDNIIKEVREYIEEHTNYDNCESKNHLDLTDRDNILEILDREVK